MADNKDLSDIAKNATDDFYELLGVAFDAEEAAIKKAYRKASIKYHPDKNPDNADAANRFIYLGWARDILLDATLKGEYDRSRTRRREKVLQDELLDGRRRKMKEDLERREQQGRDFGANLKRKRAEDMNEHEKREQEIQRLAEDGKRRRMEATERRRKEEEAEQSRLDISTTPKPSQQPTQSAEITRTIKLRFTRTPTSPSADALTTMFAKYGPVDSVVLGKDKKIRPSGEKHRKVTATAFVVFKRMDHAHRAVSEGTTDYPELESVGWAGEAPVLGVREEAPSTPISTPKAFRTTFGASFGGAGKGATPGTPKFSFSPSTPSLQEVTMMRLKEAEKKRLEEQIRRQEAAEQA
jgi:DnaJ family protein C protein 17